MEEQILYFFQANSSIFLDKLFVFFTLLGEGFFLISVAAWIYWNYNKKIGRLLVFSLIFSIVFNNVLKLVFRSPRPFEVLKKLQGKRVHTATGYSFPSGHTVGAATFYSSLSFILKKPLVYVASFLIAIAVALSQVYLAVHWPVDVLTSLLLGVSISNLVVTYLSAKEENRSRIFKFILLVNAFGVAALVVALLCKIFLFEGNLKTVDLVKSTALLNGLSWGFILDMKKECFIVDSSLVVKITRYILGLSGAYVIFKVSKSILPESGILDYLRYFIGALWLSYIFPFIGRKINLFKNS